MRIKHNHVQDHFKCYQLMTVMSENNEILVLDNKVVVSYSFLHQFLSLKHVEFVSKSTGTPPLTRFFGPWKNRVKEKACYRRSILVLKPKNREFESSKSTFSLVFTCVKLQLHVTVIAFLSFIKQKGA